MPDRLPNDITNPADYTFKVSQYYNNPIIELLYQGGRILVTDEHFGFGIKKARILMSCTKEIKEFASLQQGFHQNEYTNSRKIGPETISVEYRNSFTKPNGRTINLPFIKLSCGTIQIGFGQKKAKALYYLRHDIRKWLRKNT